MSNFKEGDIVIIKPGSYYDELYGKNNILSNPNWKIGVGIVANINYVQWFSKCNNSCKNSYNFERDLMFLSEHEEASEYWKELPLKLINKQKHNEILSKIDESKIYLESNVKVKNVDDLLQKLLIENNSSSTSALPTFYKYENTLYSQCDSNKYRSFDDILLICKTYFPSTKVETIFKKLLLLNNNLKDIKNDRVKNKLSYCSTISRIRYIANYSNSLYFFYTTAIDKNKNESKYSWKDLFKMININNVEELKEFYLKNLKDEI